MEAVIVITLLVMCIMIVFILADSSWLKWEKTDDEAYQTDEFNDFGQEEDEMEDSFESIEDEEETKEEVKAQSENEEETLNKE